MTNVTLHPHGDVIDVRVERNDIPHYAPLYREDIPQAVALLIEGGYAGTEHIFVPRATLQRRAQHSVKVALNRLQTFLDHPAYDSKADVLDALKGASYRAAGLWEVATNQDGAWLPQGAFGVDWSEYAALLRAVKALGNKGDRGDLTRTNLRVWRERIFMES